MKYTNIDGQLFKEMLLSGAYELENNKAKVNSLNVFPVPDGDTGTNMSSTMMSAVNEINSLKDVTVHSVADAASMGSLMGARGNSGVILSQLLRGISKYLKNKDNINTRDFALALKEGVSTAYRAVMKPTEGTILTVARESSEKAVELSKTEGDFLGFMEKLDYYANISLNKTPELLPVLRQAGVVDAGGKGLELIYFGMYKRLRDMEIVPRKEQESQNLNQEINKIPQKNIDSQDIKFGYCTEFFIKTQNADPEEFKKKIINFGDSLVVVGSENIIKVHIHTNQPGNVLSEALKLGELSKIKIDNMREQHRSIIDKPYEDDVNTTNNMSNTDEQEYGIITVAAGDGIVGIFKDLGVDVVIEGGQTMNPSTQDILKAIESVNAKNIFVLPNNGNIIMAAQQARDVSKKNVIVIPTKSIPQGITAVISFNPDSSVDDNEKLMTDVIGNVKTGQVTYAVRDTTFNDVEIKEGNILGIIDGKMTEAGDDVDKVTIDLLKQMVSDESQLITVLYGNGYTEDNIKNIERFVTENYPHCDASFNYGGQPLYYYIISVE